jgi:hypothetical protein
MNQTRETAGVRPLRRPPVRQATLVRRDQEHTFSAFAQQIGAWWPVEVFSAGKERVRGVTVEGRVGGRVCETWDDGRVVPWGEVTVWTPPTRFAMTWAGTPQPTEVEFTFAALGPALTRVTVEHRGWEAMSEVELQRDCALPGGYRSGAYAVGWERILTRFATSFETEGA